MDSSIDGNIDALAKIKVKTPSQPNSIRKTRKSSDPGRKIDNVTKAIPAIIKGMLSLGDFSPDRMSFLFVAYL